MRYLALLFVAAVCPAAAHAAGSMSITANQARIQIAGDISSDGHRDILENTLLREFAGLQYDLHLEVAPNLPPSWSLVTDYALRALARTQSGIAIIDVGGVVFEGFSANPDGWYDAVSRLEKLLPSGMTVRSEVAAVADETSLTGYCSQLFDAALRQARISFKNGSVKLGTNAYAALDRLLDLSRTCPDAKIYANGSAATSLGKNRANSVGDYLLQHGLAPARISVTTGGNVPAGQVYLYVRQ